MASHVEFYLFIITSLREERRNNIIILTPIKNMDNSIIKYILEQISRCDARCACIDIVYSHGLSISLYQLITIHLKINRTDKRKTISGGP
jgi:hypothetical protein